MSTKNTIRISKSVLQSNIKSPSPTSYYYMLTMETDATLNETFGDLNVTILSTQATTTGQRPECDSSLSRGCYCLSHLGLMLLFLCAYQSFRPWVSNASQNGIWGVEKTQLGLFCCWRRLMWFHLKWIFCCELTHTHTPQ